MDFGIEMSYDNKGEYNKIKVNELDVGDTIEGKPSITFKDKKSMNGNTYKTIIIELSNNTMMEYYTLYINCPNPDEEGFVYNIHKNYGFTRDLFNLIFSYQYLVDPSSTLTMNGEEKNTINRIRIKPFLDFLASKDSLQFKITEGNPDSQYNSQIITKLQ